MARSRAGSQAGSNAVLAGRRLACSGKRDQHRVQAPDGAAFDPHRQRGIQRRQRHQQQQAFQRLAMPAAHGASPARPVAAPARPRRPAMPVSGNQSRPPAPSPGWAPRCSGAGRPGSPSAPPASRPRRWPAAPIRLQRDAASRHQPGQQQDVFFPYGAAQQAGAGSQPRLPGQHAQTKAARAHRELGSVSR